MTEIFTSATMSLDGYIAGPDESGFDRLFRWYDSGEVTMETARPDLTFHLSPASADYVRTAIETIGAFVVGRHLFDVTDGWHGKHPYDKPVVVLTHRPPEDWPHPDAPFRFVTEGIDAAIEQARELAGGKAIGVNGGTIASQCLDAKLLDEVWIDLAPVILGAGTPFFSSLAGAPYDLEGPVSTVQGIDVTHLRYRVRYR